MKIGYFTDGPWGHNALDALLNDSTIEIAFVVPRNDTKDTYLKERARQNDIDYLCPILVNSDEFYETAKSYECDLFVSMSYNQIFKRRIFELPKYKTINCHAGKLPFYRGRNILNWVLINDEKEFGITVHYVDDGIDTGDIILQRTYPITDNDSYSTLLEIAYKECPSILYQAIKDIQNGKSGRIPQNMISTHGLYCGMRQTRDETINWNQTSRDIFNFVRSICEPGPKARTMCRGNAICINSIELIPSAPEYKGIPGQILGRENGKLIVKTLDSYIYLRDYSSNILLKIGDRLG